MTWGKVPADHAGQVMVDGLQGRDLYFVSIGRLVILWEARV